MEASTQCGVLRIAQAAVSAFHLKQLSMNSSSMQGLEEGGGVIRTEQNIYHSQPEKKDNCIGSRIHSVEW